MKETLAFFAIRGPRISACAAADATFMAAKGLEKCSLSLCDNVSLASVDVFIIRFISVSQMLANYVKMLTLN